MTVELFKKEKPYISKEGEEKIGTSFYVKCGDELVCVEPVYFGKENKPDKGYGIRKAMLSAFATKLPDQE